MMEKKKKYQLVAWTSNVNKDKDSLLFMTPSLHHEMQEPFYEEICRYSQGVMNSGKLQKLISAYEKNISFLILTGHYGDAIRMTGWAAGRCAETGGPEFFRMYNQFHEMIIRYDRKDILLERDSKKLEELHDRMTAMEDVQKKHPAEMKARKGHC